MMSDLGAVALWLLIYVLKGLPFVGAFYLGKRAGRRSLRHEPTKENT